MNLPDEIYRMIFDYLEIKEIINNKRVCKQWNSIINELKFKELILKEISDSTNYWYHLFRPMNLNNTIFFYKSNLIEFFNYSSFKMNFSNLKYLKIKSLKNMNFDLNQLNLFNRLELLDIDDYIYLNRVTSLELSRLKIARIFSLSLLNLDCENLEIFYCFKLASIEFKYPQSIRCLEVEMLENENLKIFTNLQIIRSDYLISSSILKRSPVSLNRIYLHTKYEFNSKFKNISLFREIIDEILNDKQQFKRDNLKLFCQGIEISNDNQLINNYNFDQNSLKIIYDHYDRLADQLPAFKFMNYNEILNIFNQQLPKCFISKFINIQDLIVEKIDNQNNLIDFLRGCPNLSKFDLRNSSSLDQEFFDNLPNICKLIVEFKIENDKIKLDYFFVTKFKILSSLVIDESNKMTNELNRLVNEFNKTSKSIDKINDLNSIANLYSIYQIAIDILSNLKFISHFKFISYVKFTMFKSCKKSGLFTFICRDYQFDNKSANELITVFNNLIDNNTSSEQKKRKRVNDD